MSSHIIVLDDLRFPNSETLFFDMTVDCQVRRVPTTTIHPAMLLAQMNLGRNEEPDFVLCD
jgi:hypothetical protein